MRKCWCVIISFSYIFQFYLPKKDGRNNEVIFKKMCQVNPNKHKAGVILLKSDKILCTVGTTKKGHVYIPNKNIVTITNFYASHGIV